MAAYARLTCRSLVRRVLFCLFVCLAPTSACAADATVFRIFLTDGTEVTSFGEYARVGDEVIFSTLAGGTPDDPRLHLVTLSAALVDWTRTDRYAASARYARYAASRGEEDFALLNAEVARVLNDIALTTDRARALELAESARRTMSNWPQEHFGYRQDDVREIVGLLDEAINSLRAVRAGTRFELALVATPSLEREALRPATSPGEQVQQLVHLSTLVPTAVERVSLLQSELGMLAEMAVSPSPALPPGDIDAMRRSVEQQVRTELAVDARFARWARRLSASSKRAASDARVPDVERILNSLDTQAATLGGSRPEVVQGLRASITADLQGAQRLRLFRDRWSLRRATYRDYQRAVASDIILLAKAKPMLEAIRRLEGPAPERLVSLRARLAGGADRLQRASIASDLEPLHDLLVATWRFAESAVNGRYAAVSAGDVPRAWEASSAAAGALMMLARTQSELRALLEPPRLE